MQYSSFRNTIPTFLFLMLFTWLGLPLFAQVPYNAAAPNGYTKKALVAEQIGLTDISISYQRPKLNGREGKIWGQVIHKGFIDQGFGNRKPAPWRAGANETTIIEFDHDVKVEGQSLAKGKYGFFIAYDSLASTVIFSRKYSSWGSFFYDEKDDVLRVKVKPQPLDKVVESLKFEFSGQTPNSAIISLSWDKLSIPFKVEVDYFKQQLDAFAAESQNPKGFTPQGLNIAANWALQNNYGLDKALEWATLATAPTFPGDPTSFSALSTKAMILDKLGRSEEAARAIKTAIAYGNPGQLQQFGRQLIGLNKPKMALDVFQYNFNKAPDQFITLTGMARGLSANGEYAKALDFASRALPLAPNDQAKNQVQGMVDKLKANKDIN
jgi:tetratricopeptide (TPR) repeat protein